MSVQTLSQVLLFLLFCNILGIAWLFFFYPALLFLGTRSRSRKLSPRSGSPVSLCLITVVRNGEEIIARKARNSIDLTCSGTKSVVITSDGSVDRTAERLAGFKEEGIEVHLPTEHKGKAARLNDAALARNEDILVFTDADALLDDSSLTRLTAHFSDLEVGGVCGQRVVAKDDGSLGEAQRTYVGFDSAIKTMESRLGSITSNDGKLYCIRRELFRPVPADVTDDLYVGLNVIAQGYRFVYESGARASVRTPSRSAKHELERRRRIVNRSLTGLWRMRGLTNPLNFGLFSFQLVTNKILRRLLPLFLLGTFLCSALLAPIYSLASVLVLGQLSFYALAVAYPLVFAGRAHSVLRKASSVPYYFCVGNLGTLLGLVDFLLGRRVVKWEPRKTGSGEP